MIKIKTAVQARKYILSRDIKIYDGEIYNIYRDGCLAMNAYDPQGLAYFPEDNIRTRCCLFHDDVRFLIKYKRCRCGSEKIGIKLQPSLYCNYCKNQPVASYISDYKARKRNWSTHWRGDYCVGLRVCSIKSKKLECESCDEFIPIFRGVDPLQLRRMRGVA